MRETKVLIFKIPGIVFSNNWLSLILQIVFEKNYNLLYSHVWPKKIKIPSWLPLNTFTSKLASLWNKAKLTAVARKTQEEKTRSTSCQVRPFLEWTRKTLFKLPRRLKAGSLEMPQVISRTKSLILVSLSKLDEFLLNRQVQTQSRTVPGTSGNTELENEEPNRDGSQNDPHPDVFHRSPHSADSDPDDFHHRENPHSKFSWDKNVSRNIEEYITQFFVWENWRQSVKRYPRKSVELKGGYWMHYPS